MNRTLRTTVINSARKIRAWCEAENVSQGGPKYTNFSGWCAIASARLFQELTTAGIQPEINMAVDGDTGVSHVFLVVDDHVVDITATQFEPFQDKKLVIMHAKEAEVHWFYQPKESYRSVNKLREAQISRNWPKSQLVPA